MSVYFVQAGEGGPVKIGFSTDVASRLTKMQADNPAQLTLLGVAPDGTATLEAELHRRFSCCVLRGEWYWPEPDLIDLAKSYPLPMKARRVIGNTVLSTYLSENGIKLADFGRRIGRSEATVSRLARGVQKPDWDTVEAIHRETGGQVTANDFMAEADTPDAAA